MPPPPHLTSHYSATSQANPLPGYNSETDIDIIHPMHPHLSSLELLPDVLLGSRTEVFIPVPHLTPPSCSQSEENNPTPTACQAFEQAMQGMVVFPSHQPWLPSFQPEPNPHLGTSTEPFSPHGHSPTRPLTSSSHKDGRSLSPCSEEANFHQRLFNPPSSVNIPPNTDWRSCSVISGKGNILHQSLHKLSSANTAANVASVINTFKGPVCAPPACVNTASPPLLTLWRRFLHHFKGLLKYHLK